MRTAHALQEHGMRLAQQAIRQRQVTQLLDRGIDGLDVIMDFLPIVTLFRIKVPLLGEGLFDAGFGALDTAGSRGFFGDVHPNEEIDVGDQLGKGVQLAEQAIGIFQQRRDLRIRHVPFMIDGGR